MNVYFKWIPSKAHVNEDSYTWLNLETKNGKHGLFLIADGCSGYEGRKASEAAVRTVVSSIKERIYEEDISDYCQLLRDSIVNASEELKTNSAIRSTLDVVLTGPDSLYVGHVGDSRVCLVYEDGHRFVTPEETSGNGPTNFLGLAYIDGKGPHIKDRIHLYECKLNEEGITTSEEVHYSALYKRDNGDVIEERTSFYQPYQPTMGKLLYVFLYTDGLTSRATDDDISKILTRLAVERNAQQALNDLADIVEGNCRGRLLELAANNSLKRDILTKAVEEEIREKGITLDLSLPVKDLVDDVITLYKSGNVRSLVQSMDNRGLKHDDTTMMLVDVKGSFQLPTGERTGKSREEIYTKLTACFASGKKPTSIAIDLNNMAAQAAQEGHLDDALLFYQITAYAQPINPWIPLEAASIHIKKGAYDAALKACDKAEALAQANITDASAQKMVLSWTNFWRGKSHEGRGDFLPAQEAYAHAVTYDSSNQAANDALARITEKR